LYGSFQKNVSINYKHIAVFWQKVATSFPAAQVSYGIIEHVSTWKSSHNKSEQTITCMCTDSVSFIMSIFSGNRLDANGKLPHSFTRMQAT
jgi:hypothetical protein